jgi:hypothetical protein
MFSDNCSVTDFATVYVNGHGAHWAKSTEGSNKKLSEELIAYFPLIWHELHRKKLVGGSTDTETANWHHKSPNKK